MCLIEGTGSCPLYSGVPEAPWKTPAPWLQPTYFHPSHDRERRELWLRACSRRDAQAAAAPRPRARSGLRNWQQRMLRAGGQGHPAANPASTLTHCMAVGKSVNLPDSHWEEPVFIIPSTEPITVASGLQTAIGIFSPSGSATARNREHLRFPLAEVPRAPRPHTRQGAHNFQPQHRAR